MPPATVTLSFQATEVQYKTHTRQGGRRPELSNLDLPCLLGLPGLSNLETINLKFSQDCWVHGNTQRSVCFLPVQDTLLACVYRVMLLHCGCLCNIPKHQTNLIKQTKSIVLKTSVFKSIIINFRLNKLWNKSLRAKINNFTQLTNPVFFGKSIPSRRTLSLG